MRQDHQNRRRVQRRPCRSQGTFLLKPNRTYQGTALPSLPYTQLTTTVRGSQSNNRRPLWHQRLPLFLSAPWHQQWHGERLGPSFLHPCPEPPPPPSSPEQTGAGYISGSSALMADGAASLSDLVSGLPPSRAENEPKAPPTSPPVKSVTPHSSSPPSRSKKHHRPLTLCPFTADGITLWSMRASRQPSNQEHPYGHGRLETIGTLGVAGFLVTTGAGFCYTSLQGLYDAYLVSVGAAAPEGMGMLEGPLWVAMAAGFASLVVKEGLFRATKSAGERAGSKVADPLLIAPPFSIPSSPRVDALRGYVLLCSPRHGESSETHGFEHRALVSPVHRAFVSRAQQCHGCHWGHMASQPILPAPRMQMTRKCPSDERRL